jgi:hypothetical protein
LGNATGTVGVDEGVAGGVLDGNIVGVLRKLSVGDGVKAVSVGVSVTGAFEGRLQASTARMSARIGNNILDFIVLLLKA